MIKDLKICTVCNFIGKPKLKGSGGVELLLWICYLVPGLIYHVWRHSDKGNKCPECDNTAMIPVHTPKAQDIIGASESQIVFLKEKSEEQKIANEARVKANQQSNRNIIIMAIILGLLLIFSIVGSSLFN